MDLIYRQSILFLILFAAAISDLEKERVPNRLCAGGCLIGIGLSVCEYGIKGVLEGIAGMLLPIVLLFPLFVFRMLGAGDIKLFAAAGSFFGPVFVFRHMVFSFAAGAVISAGILIKNGNFGERLFVLRSFLYAKDGKIRNYYNRERDGNRDIIHFTVSMLLAYVFTVSLGLG